MHKRTTCPVCHAEKSTLLVHVVTEQVALRDNLVYRFCEACGLVFSEIQFSSSELDEIYDEAFREKDRSEFLKYTQYKIQVNSYRKKWLDRTVARIGWNPPKRQALEIGPKDGSFLHLLQQDGWSVLGIDPNVTYGKMAKELYGVEFSAAHFSQSALNGERFDLITGFHVIEHVQNPLEFLAGIRQNLRDDGLLYLEMPNLHAMQRRHFITQHVMLFCRHSLGQILEHAGFQVLEVSECAPGIMTFDQLGILARPSIEKPATWESRDSLDSVKAALEESLRSKFPETDRPTLKNRIFRLAQRFLGERVAGELKGLYRKVQYRRASRVSAKPDDRASEKLPGPVQDALVDGVLSRDHVAELTRLPDEFLQLKVLARIKAHRLDVGETRNLVTKELGA